MPISAIMTVLFIHLWTAFQNIVNFVPENNSQARK